jgi:hypothetical protein
MPRIRWHLKSDRFSIRAERDTSLYSPCVVKYQDIKQASDDDGEFQFHLMSMRAERGFEPARYEHSLNRIGQRFMYVEIDTLPGVRSGQCDQFVDGIGCDQFHSDGIVKCYFNLENLGCWKTPPALIIYQAIRRWYGRCRSYTASYSIYGAAPRNILKEPAPALRFII